MTPRQQSQLQAVLTMAHHNYAKGLNGYAFFKIHNRALGEDLVQNTFLKTWSYLIAGGKVDTMKAFLYHILNNLVIDEYRKHKELSLDHLLEKGFEPGVNESESLFNFLDGKSAMLLINQLPEKFQRVMRMKYVQDLSLKDMSLIIGQSKNTIAVQAHRGLEKLKSLYNSESELYACIGSAYKEKIA